MRAGALPYFERLMASILPVLVEWRMERYLNVRPWEAAVRGRGESRSQASKNYEKEYIFRHIWSFRLADFGRWRP